MRLSARRLNRATLQRQLLLERAPISVADAVQRVMAIQAQSPASPYLALWNRILAFEAVELDTAFTTHTVVKATLMRVTLHAVRVADYPRFHSAMRPSLRASIVGDPRFTAHGVTAADTDALVPRVLEHAAEPRSNGELEAFLRAHAGDPELTPGLWWALRRFSPLVHAPTGGPWSFGARPAYVASPVAPVATDHVACLAHLIRRYLAAFGPASIADAAQFGRLAMAGVRAAFALLDDELVRYASPDGVELFDLAEATLPDADVPAPPRLMPMWDSTLLAYADRSRILPSEYRKQVIRANGDVLPTLLVDGLVAGVWRPVRDGIEATAFHPLRTPVWDALADEAAALPSWPTVSRSRTAGTAAGGTGCPTARSASSAAAENHSSTLIHSSLWARLEDVPAPAEPRPDVEGLLREADLRVTRPRVAVLTALRDHPHADTDSIIGVVRADLGEVSHQAVYDVLRALTTAGLIRRIQPSGSVARYEVRVGDNHHHVVCRSCGAIADADCAVGTTPCLTASDDHGFVIDEAEVIYWGLCPECSGVTSVPTSSTRT